MNTFTYEDFWETQCHCALAAIDLDYSVFLANYGEDSFTEFKARLENCGFIFRGILNDSAIFALPTNLLDVFREEIELILEEEVFAD